MDDSGQLNGNVFGCGHIRSSNGYTVLYFSTKQADILAPIGGKSAEEGEGERIGNAVGA